MIEQTSQKTSQNPVANKAQTGSFCNKALELGSSSIVIAATIGASHIPNKFLIGLSLGNTFLYKRDVALISIELQLALNFKGLQSEQPDTRYNSLVGLYKAYDKAPGDQQLEIISAIFPMLKDPANQNNSFLILLHFMEKRLNDNELKVLINGFVLYLASAGELNFEVKNESLIILLKLIQAIPRFIKKYPAAIAQQKINLTLLTDAFLHVQNCLPVDSEYTPFIAGNIRIMLQ